MIANGIVVKPNKKDKLVILELDGMFGWCEAIPCAARFWA